MSCIIIPKNLPHEVASFACTFNVNVSASRSNHHFRKISEMLFYTLLKGIVWKWFSFLALETERECGSLKNRARAPLKNGTLREAPLNRGTRLQAQRFTFTYTALIVLFVCFLHLYRGASAEVDSRDL